MKPAISLQTLRLLSKSNLRILGIFRPSEDDMSDMIYVGELAYCRWKPELGKFSTYFRSCSVGFFRIRYNTKEGDIPVEPTHLHTIVSKRSHWDPQEVAEARESEKKARDLIMQLLYNVDPVSRKIVTYRYGYDLSFKQISKLVGLSDDTCSAKTIKALYTMRQRGKKSIQLLDKG